MIWWRYTHKWVRYRNFSSLLHWLLTQSAPMKWISHAGCSSWSQDYALSLVEHRDYNWNGSISFTFQIHGTTTRNTHKRIRVHTYCTHEYALRRSMTIFDCRKMAAFCDFKKEYSAASAGYIQVSAWIGHEVRVNSEVVIVNVMLLPPVRALII